MCPALPFTASGLSFSCRTDSGCRWLTRPISPASQARLRGLRPRRHEGQLQLQRLMHKFQLMSHKYHVAILCRDYRITTMAQTKDPMARNEVTQVLSSYSGELRTLAVFSMVINLLLLTPSVYMLQVYDRVL